MKKIWLQWTRCHFIWCRKIHLVTLLSKLNWLRFSIISGLNFNELRIDCNPVESSWDSCKRCGGSSPPVMDRSDPLPCRLQTPSPSVDICHLFQQHSPTPTPELPQSQCNYDSSSTSHRVTLHPLLACPSSAEKSSGVPISLSPHLFSSPFSYALIWGRHRLLGYLSSGKMSGNPCLSHGSPFVTAMPGHSHWDPLSSCSSGEWGTRPLLSSPYTS